MPRCIVPGCNSGYNSNPEKVHFFGVPKNLAAIRLWNIAIRRKSKSVRAGESVCHKHFLENDILWRRELLAPDGTIVGISPYKVPRRRPGAVPLLFPWTEIYTLDPSNPSTVDGTSVALENVEHIVPKIEKCEKLIENANQFESRILVGDESNRTIDCRNTVMHPSKEPYTFVKIEPMEQCDNILKLTLRELTANVSLPSGWSMQYMACGSTNLVSIQKQSCVKINDHYKTVILKDIIITDDMSVQINILDQKINAANLHLASTVTDIEEFQDLLYTMNNLNVCTGSHKQSEIPSVASKIISKDNSGNWRHVECPLVLVDAITCEFCQKAKDGRN